MRRPVRPFVTEYRGGSRRSPHQGLGLDVDPFKAELGPSGAGAWPPTAPPQPELQEDSYDAALRAADALFAGQRSAPNAPPETDGDAPRPGSGGRVLRVLDEVPSPEMQRLEEEFAPKKRGRKPGSKNKPKIAALAPAPVEALQPTAGAAPAMAAVTPLAAVLGDVAIAVARKQGVPLATGPRGERYAWVRTRLKPGQQWKRRLPKVAW